MSGPGTVRLHATGVPQLDAQPYVEYWIGAPWVSVDAPPTICARTGSSFWHYSGTAWIKHTTPWKSRHGLTIQYNPDTNIVERLTVVGGTVRRDTLMLGGSTVTNFEISGDGSTYYLNESQNPSGWKVYYAGTTWNFRGLASYVELVPSFNGATLCGISQTANTVNYIPQLTSPKLVTIPGSPARIYAAIIGSLVVVGRASTISAFRADGVLRTIRTVAGTITGVFADASSVWVGTDTDHILVIRQRSDLVTAKQCACSRSVVSGAEWIFL